MKRNTILLFFFFILSTFSSLFSQVDVYETLVVERIDINFMNTPPGAQVNSSIILSRIKTQEGKIFSQVDFDDDLKSLAQDYDDIEPDVCVVEGRIFITLNISLKPIIRSIQWCGNQSISSGKLQKEFGINIGSVFDSAIFNKAFFDIKKFYVKKGFFESEIEYDLERDFVTNEVDIIINICEGRSGKIRDILFQNFTPEEKSEVESMLMTQPWNFFYSFFYDVGVYSEQAMMQDQYILINFFQDKGYADAKVSIRPVESKLGTIVIEISVDKGQRYTFGSITVEGNDLFTEEEILNCIPIKEGEWFSPQRTIDSVNRIKDMYGAKGYIDAVVEFEPTLDPDLPLYKVNFYIDSGEQYRVGLIRVLGNWSTQARVILHECLLVPGEVFNIQKLKASEIRLQNMGYFSSVNIYAVRSDDRSCLGECYRDVNIEVVETTTGNFSAFLGLSSFESIFGGLSICEKNFNIGGITCIPGEGLTALRGGGEYAFFSTAIGAKSRKYSFSWSKPYFYDTLWVVGFDIDSSNIRYVSNDYQLNSLGYRLHARYPLTAYSRFGTHYRIRNSNVVINNPETASPQLKSQARNSGLISAIGLSLAYDSTDHPLLPSKGLRAAIEGEFAGVGGNHNFFSAGYLSSYYYPTDTCGIFKARADFKFIFPTFGTEFKDVPLEERYFLGGIGSVRGFRDFSLGPKFPGQGNDDPTGGISLTVLSLEYIYRWKPLCEPFVFFDMGQISTSILSFAPFQTSAGFGIRSCIMPGSPPLILGLGYPINVSPENKGDIKNFFFSLGGNF